MVVPRFAQGEDTLAYFTGEVSMGRMVEEVLVQGGLAREGESATETFKWHII